MITTENVFVIVSTFLLLSAIILLLFTIRKMKRSNGANAGNQADNGMEKTHKIRND